MTAVEFKRSVDEIGLNVSTSAPFLGISLRQAQRIAAGEYPAPLAIVRLLRLMIAKKITAEKLRD